MAFSSQRGWSFISVIILVSHTHRPGRHKYESILVHCMHMHELKKKEHWKLDLFSFLPKNTPLKEHRNWIVVSSRCCIFWNARQGCDGLRTIWGQSTNVVNLDEGCVGDYRYYAIARRRVCGVILVSLASTRLVTLRVLLLDWQRWEYVTTTLFHQCIECKTQIMFYLLSH